jgi:hypothetical protein
MITADTLFRYIYPEVLSRREFQVYKPWGFIKDGSPDIYTLGFYRGGNCRYIIDCSISQMNNVSAVIMTTILQTMHHLGKHVTRGLPPGFIYLEFPPR